MSEMLGALYEDPYKMTMAIVAVSAVASFFLMQYYEKQLDPIRDELKEALKHHEKPSILYRFLMDMTAEKSEKYFNMKNHLLKIDGAPTEKCVNQLLKVCELVNDPVTFNRTYKLVNRIRFYHKVKLAWTKVEKFSKENEQHEAMLMKLWSTLKPTEELDNRLSKKWIDVGFQGQDPATDFRGSGLTGLKQLHTLCTAPSSSQEALRMYQQSTVQEQWFFFAVTGINITQRILNSLNDSKDQVYRVDLDAHILDSKHPVPGDDNQMTRLMNLFYKVCFTEFTEKWVAAKPNIMEFNQFLDDIYGMQFAKRIPALLDQFNQH